MKKFKLHRDKRFYSPYFDALGSYTGTSDAYGQPEQDADDL